MRSLDRRVLLACAIAVVVAGGILAVAGFGNDDEPVFERARDVGRDPFVRGAARPVPIRFTTLRELSRAADEAAASSDDGREQRAADKDADHASSGEEAVRASRRRIDAVVATARRRGVDVEEPDSPAGAPLYGGSGRNACDTERLKRFFETHPKQAAAWARVHGIEPSEISEFLDDLTGGWLLADTEVVNHGYVDGRARPVRSILEAGTAVLVDDGGIPRVRCICGNPLRQADESRTSINLTGIWRSDDYECPWGVKHREVVSVVHRGDRIVATKVTGDRCVPAGFETFSGHMPRDAPVAPITWTLGNPDAPGASSGPGSLTIVNRDEFRVDDLVFVRARKP